MKQPYNTALYMRLSRDDESFGDSVSIGTQRLVLTSFAHDNGFNVVDEYVDDGWSGTNFERPGFQRMLQDIEAGKINCILVKDLSRFGREHVKVDYFLEFYFPERQIRFIAVTDNEDTERGLSDSVPFKNLLNEYWAKDTSKKTKAALRAKHLAGEYTSQMIPLGYKRDPDRKNHLIVDEETSWIVKKVFDLAAHGYGKRRIVQELVKEKIPTPGYVAFQRYGLFAATYLGAPPEKAYDWSLTTVKTMLRNEVYIGTTVHNKVGTVSYKNKKVIHYDTDSWLRIKRTHEAIIDEETFWQVQEQVKSRQRASKATSTPHIFAGLVRCADCGATMAIMYVKDNRYRYFNCNSYRKYGKKTGICTAHSIRYDVLSFHVLSRIQHWIHEAHTDEHALTKSLLKSVDTEKQAAVKKRTAELKKAEKRKAEIDRLFMKMYEDRANERITEYNFQMMSQKYQTEQQELDARIQELQKFLAESRQAEDDAAKWINLIKQYEQPTELTSELVHALIEKILIHEPVKLDHGYKDQEIEIYYRFVGKID